MTFILFPWHIIHFTTPSALRSQHETPGTRHYTIENSVLKKKKNPQSAWHTLFFPLAVKYFFESINFDLESLTLGKCFPR